MTTSYAGSPAASPKDMLRFMSGDVGPGAGGFPFVLQDEELTALYVASAGPNTNAAAACDAIAARLSFQIDMGAEGVSSRASQRADAFRKQADRYRALALKLGEPGASPSAAGVGAPFVGVCEDLPPCQPDPAPCYPLPGRYVTGGYGRDGWP